MGTHVGIELSPVACRIVELDGTLEPRRPLATRVRSYAILPPVGPVTDRHFATLRGRPAAVVVWGAGSRHRQVVVDNGTYEKMRVEAIGSLDVDVHAMLGDIAPASTVGKGASRQRVVVAAASAAEVAVQARPLVDAGIRIRSVMSPADALLGLARARRAAAVAGGIEAYVVIDESVGCIALVQNGALVGARELAWGYGEGTTLQPVPSRREDLAARLADELKGFLAACGDDGDALTQVSICGGLPELRTMTVPLMERLDVEVETLDSLFGIDGERLPDPADEFRERTSELRLAWSAAADWNGPINLYRLRRRRRRRAMLARAAVFAGAVAGLGGGWAIEQSAWWQTPPSPVIAKPMAAATVPAAKAPSPSRSAAASPARAAAAPASPRATTPPAISAPIVAAARSAPPPTPPAKPPTAVPPAKPPTAAPSVARTTPPPARVPAPSVRAAAPPTARVPPPIRTPSLQPPPAAPLAAVTAPRPPSAPTKPSAAPAPNPAGLSVPRAVAASSAVPSRRTATVPAPRPDAARPRSTEAAPETVAKTTGPAAAAPSRQSAAARRAPLAPPPVPFDAVLGTILYSPDRKLAIVNGRIVGIGDGVNGAQIVDITQGMVLLRDEKGRLRSLTLAGGAPAGPPQTPR